MPGAVWQRQLSGSSVQAVLMGALCHGWAEERPACCKTDLISLCPPPPPLPHTHTHQEAVHLSLFWYSHFVTMNVPNTHMRVGPGIESRWGRDFLQPSRPALGPTQLYLQWVQGFSLG
jgi:hypothetical protein